MKKKTSEAERDSKDGKERRSLFTVNNIKKDKERSDREGDGKNL